MSSLQRYKKSGGFYQLLSLIETFGPQKKEKFLEMIDAESSAWGQALREKMLTLERVFSWPDQVVIEVIRRLPIKSQAYALQGLKEEYKAKVMPFYSASDQRRMDDVLTENKPKPEEIQATLFKLVEVARKMIQERELTPEKFDPGLVIPEDFEFKLEGQGTGGSSSSYAAAESAMNSVAAAAAAATSSVSMTQAGPDISQLQKTLTALLKENKSLKEEVRGLQSRLEQIRKIA